MLKAITVDLWNTLFKNKFYSEERFEILTEFLETKRITFSLEDLKKEYLFQFNLHDIDIEVIGFRHIYTEERLFKLFKSISIDYTENEVKELVIKFEEELLNNLPELKPGVKETLEEISKNYKIGLISNTGITPGRVLTVALKKLGIHEYFSALTYSDEIGYYKPKALLFESTLEQLACKPVYAVHIGDSLETDVKGAMGFNMKAIWVRDIFSIKNPNITPDYEVQEIPEILPIINELNY